MENPDDILCYCNLCTRRQVQRFAEIYLDYDRVVQVSGAGSGCGSCQPEVEDLVEQAQQAAGNPCTG